jgi:membrane-bound hydrogenase subunit mbhJ
VFGRHALRHSAWLFPLNSGSCNGCDQEIQALHAARYALEEGGIAFAASPRHADILLLTGVMTSRNQDAAWRVLAQLAEPHAVIAIGDCPINGSVFRSSEDAARPWKDFPIDVELPGCPPSPTLILEAIEAAIQLLDGSGEAEETEGGEDSEEAKKAETSGQADEQSEAEDEASGRADPENGQEHP